MYVWTMIGDGLEIAGRKCRGSRDILRKYGVRKGLRSAGMHVKGEGLGIYSSISGGFELSGKAPESN